MSGKLILLRPTPMTDDAPSDQDLLARCAGGDASALGALFDRHHQRVRRFVHRVSSAPSDVDDIVQTTFCEIWRSAGRYRPRSTVLSWIFGIAANVVRHHKRSEARKKNALLVLAGGPEKESARPDDAAEQAELLSRLSTEIPRLSHELRVAFVMCDLEDVAGVDAARALGVRPGTLWRRLHDARRRLREALEGGGE